MWRIMGYSRSKWSLQIEFPMFFFSFFVYLIRIPSTNRYILTLLSLHLSQEGHVPAWSQGGDTLIVDPFWAIPSWLKKMEEKWIDGFINDRPMQAKTWGIFDGVYIYKCTFSTHFLSVHCRHSILAIPSFSYSIWILFFIDLIWFIDKHVHSK